MRPVLLNFSQGQLAGIGAVAMSYNDAERALHELFDICGTYRGPQHELSSRIGGTDGIAALIRIALPYFPRLGEPLAGEIGDSLAAFAKVKGLRDAVIHANMLDTGAAVGMIWARQGGYRHVLLTVKALRWLTATTQCVAEELRSWSTVLHLASALSGKKELTDLRTAELEAEMDASISDARGHRSNRLSLGSEPRFPTPTTIHSLVPPPDDA